MINIVFVSAEPKLDKIFVNSLKSASFFNMNMTASFVDKSLDRTEVSISFVFAPNLTQHCFLYATINQRSFSHRL